ncbi:serine/threonine-protein kinase [Nocardia coubleae]|uniref:non-specific serine/threonine protein kinase n=1 Tax=Nocardia coubleae TaxID=356147 RepID=A0A846WFK7_9NOCA|nr:serine/threonine-protein kinase [Nocardia coubleae]NKX91367.1 protein kinase [Nocardia coubleae]
MHEIGDVFAGFTIERMLGQGGMGTVYLARHPRLDRLTALKLLNRDLFADARIRARFEREADLAAALDHPGIVTVFDRGAEDEQLWISMQYVDGIDAATVDPRTLPPQRAVQIIEGVADALDYAHGHGVLHRDVKPANILLARSGGGQGERVFLTDFGIARLRADSTHLTQQGMFTATLAYASPEQMTGAELDHRSDQYSLACTLYWLFTGLAPFDSPDPNEIIRGTLYAPPPPLALRRTGLPPAMDAVLAAAMAKHPAARYESCTAFAKAARRALTSTKPPVLPASYSPQPVPGQLASMPAPGYAPPLPAAPQPNWHPAAPPVAPAGPPGGQPYVGQPPVQPPVQQPVAQPPVQQGLAPQPLPQQPGVQPPAQQLAPQPPPPQLFAPPVSHQPAAQPSAQRPPAQTVAQQPPVEQSPAQPAQQQSAPPPGRAPGAAKAAAADGSSSIGSAVVPAEPVAEEVSSTAATDVLGMPNQDRSDSENTSAQTEVTAVPGMAATRQDSTPGAAGGATHTTTSGAEAHSPVTEVDGESVASSAVEAAEPAAPRAEPAWGDGAAASARPTSTGSGTPAVGSAEVGNARTHVDMPDGSAVSGAGKHNADAESDTDGGAEELPDRGDSAAPDLKDESDHGASPAGDPVTGAAAVDRPFALGGVPGSDGGENVASPPAAGEAAQGGEGSDVPDLGAHRDGSGGGERGHDVGAVPSQAGAAPVASAGTPMQPPGGGPGMGGPGRPPQGRHPWPVPYRRQSAVSRPVSGLQRLGWVVLAALVAVLVTVVLALVVVVLPDGDDDEGAVGGVVPGPSSAVAEATDSFLASRRVFPTLVPQGTGIEGQGYRGANCVGVRQVSELEWKEPALQWNPITAGWQCERVENGLGAVSYLVLEYANSAQARSAMDAFPAAVRFGAEKDGVPVTVRRWVVPDPATSRVQTAHQVIGFPGDPDRDNYLVVVSRRGSSGTGGAPRPSAQDEVIAWWAEVPL